MLFSHAIKKSNTLVLWRPNISVCQSKSSFYSWLCLGTENHTLFVSLGTTKGFGLITRVNPKPSQCTLLQKCKIDQAKNIDNLNADLTIFCNYCKDWKHMLEWVWLDFASYKEVKTPSSVIRANVLELIMSQTVMNQTLISSS